jgi:DNA-binding LacI/PurR family transcriptional regulator
MHDRVAAVIRKDLKSLKPGERLDSMRTLAARYQVSLNTIRMALVLLQQEGQIELRHGSGCYRKMPDGQDRHVAILVELDVFRPGVSHFFGFAIQKLRSFFEAASIPSRLYVGHVADSLPVEDLTCSDFLQEVQRQSICGVAAIATLPLWGWTDMLRQQDVPIVGMGGPHRWFDAVVNSDLEGGIREAVRILAEAGRRRPALLGWGGTDVYQEAVQAHGMTFNPKWVRTTFSPTEPGAGWSEFREIWVADNEKPDGILICDDMLFHDAWPAIRDVRARVPEDLMVVVLGNKGAPLPRPFPITRLDCDSEEFARAMGSLLLALMAGEHPTNRNVNVPYRAVESETPEFSRMRANGLVAQPR